MKNKLAIGTLVCVDSMIVVIIPLIAMLVRFEGNIKDYDSMKLISLLPALLIVRLICFYGFRLYHRLWRYASINELLAIVGSVTLSTLILIVYTLFVSPEFPQSIHIISWILTIAVVGASRLCIRLLSSFRQRTKETRSRLLIVGAGDAGAMIAREINHHYYASKKIVGFIDDDSYKQHKMIYGAKVLGRREDIKRIAEENQITEIIIAMPSVSGDIVREIVSACKQPKCTVKILPGMYELIDGKVAIPQLRDVDLADLLKREPVKLNIDGIAKYLKNKRVLVTGAGGSIGSELCRQIAKLSPSQLILLGKGENSIYEINRELQGKNLELALAPIIADVRDKERIQSIFTQYKPEVVFHAAAHKHVPLMEIQPLEAVKNNVWGTKTVAEAADQAGTEIFVMISTDKAVNPTSVMGATKRVAELIIQNMNKTSMTKFVAVRFGNVLGSRGSVVPLFKKQIASGGPLTITHPEMKRYFMTIPEAAQLVLQAGSMAKGGEVFVLDMGEPIKVVDLAWDLVELSGLTPHKDIDLKFIGLRPGEKLFEEMMTAEEGTSATKHQKVYVANLKDVDRKSLVHGLRELRSVTHPIDVINTLQKLVPTYTRPVNKTFTEKRENHPDVAAQTGTGTVKLIAVSTNS